MPIIIFGGGPTTTANPSALVFSDLYGTELDRELGSQDRTILFTTALRQIAINAAQGEWNERTECLTRDQTITLVDETQEYDLEDATDFGGLTTQGVSIKITPASGSVRYIEGDDLTIVSVDTLNHEHPNWRAVAPGTPSAIYLRRTGGTLMLGLHPAPAITVGDTWHAIVPYLALPADMTADADLPFTVDGDAIASMRPYVRALVHFAAYDLEKYRKDQARGATQLQLFEHYIERYLARMRPKNGQRVRMVQPYRVIRRSALRADPRVFP